MNIAQDRATEIDSISALEEAMAFVLKDVLHDPLSDKSERKQLGVVVHSSCLSREVRTMASERLLEICIKTPRELAEDISDILGIYFSPCGEDPHELYVYQFDGEPAIIYRPDPAWEGNDDVCLDQTEGWVVVARISHLEEVRPIILTLEVIES